MALIPMDYENTIELNPTKNTTDWTSNGSTAFRTGRLICVNIYVLGTPAYMRTILTGLPKPNSAVSFVIPSANGNSIGTVDANGSIAFTSLGTTAAGYYGGTVAYMTTE